MTEQKAANLMGAEGGSVAHEPAYSVGIAVGNQTDIVRLFLQEWD